ncbi:hypothetical protein VOLCADRAFT_119010 [Volvox carteri f. nagariensis]|uniref:Major facilitator superfamily (MFS) profile domain-containing protein n=1 Tax=Volvox carteri f. nagariensis TaxID=3068 RepID=D8U9F6_VOLCA|nr:uncharacterized protein VOLCADRAFT_119010 [Volvox carteri f. nagariensis]EFJ43631.1 hypothetical protein VOLCADRAFT_119010 [Volvox carteri f. nagariensis]|eukprot:XP_002955331.1 hypothetical protein VOLCADRAFT_119010 [Volvox carteri f. nagariensis]
MTSSLLMFQMTFTYADPLAGSGPPAWRCANAADSPCMTLLNEQLSASAITSSATSEVGTAPAGAERLTAAQSFCDLNPSQYIWNNPEMSLSSEYNLVCGQAWKAGLLDTLFFAGFMAGNGVFGRVADRHGRRSTMTACAAATAVVTALSASPLVPTGPEATGTASGAGGGGGDSSRSSSGGGGYWLHLVLRCVSGALCAGQSLGGYVLATETVGPEWRGTSGMLTQSFFILGEFMLVGLSLAFPPWRGLTLAVAASCAAVLLLVPLVPESPRWLLLHGKANQARAAFLWVARINRVRSPPPLECTPGGAIYLDGALTGGPIANLQHGRGDDDGNGNGSGKYCATAAAVITEIPGGGTYCRTATSPSPTNEFDCAAEEETAPLVAAQRDDGSSGGSSAGAGAGGDTAAVATTGLFAVLAHPVTRCLLLSTCFVLFALSVSYYGVTLALGSLVAGSLHLNFFLTAAAELPGYLLLAATTDRMGRRTAITAGTALAGVASLACAFTSGGVLQVVFAMAGKLGCSGAWAVGLTFAAELFPTCIRSAALSVASQSGDLGGLVTPVVLMLRLPGRFERLPFAVMGLMALVALVLVAKLPETRGMPQLDTFDELLEWLHRNGRTTAATAATAASAAAAGTAVSLELTRRDVSAAAPYGTTTELDVDDVLRDDGYGCGSGEVRQDSSGGGGGGLEFKLP